MKANEPGVRVYQQGAVIHFPPTCWEGLTNALESGAAFWEGTTIHGATVMIRLSTVTDVHFMTADSIASAKADDEEAQWQDA